MSNSLKMKSAVTISRILHQLFLICEIVNVIINENNDNRRYIIMENKALEMHRQWNGKLETVAK